jgi:hypothetical protein
MTSCTEFTMPHILFKISALKNLNPIDIYVVELPAELDMSDPSFSLID